MRICILCEESNLPKLKGGKIRPEVFQTKVSSTGELPATHRLCTMVIPDSRLSEFTGDSELVTVEEADAKDFLASKNLKIIQ